MLSVLINAADNLAQCSEEYFVSEVFDSSLNRKITSGETVGGRRAFVVIY